MENRIFYSNDGTLTDFSIELNKYQSGSKNIAGFVAAEDKIFIGSRQPFNHFYIKLGTNKNTNPSNMTIKYWNGESFFDTVEIIDETDGVQASGFVTFFPNRDERWDRESTNFSGDSVTGLTSVVVYDQYWTEVTFSANLTSLDIDWIGQLFCDDEDLGSEFPDLNRLVMRDAFLKDGEVSGDKTDWQEQVAAASKIMIKDLIAMRVIRDKGQIIERSELQLPCVSKLAEVIYRGLGDDYVDDRTSARQEYSSRLNKSIFKTDKNANALLDVGEEKSRTGFMNR